VAIKTLPLHGKVRLASAPANPVFGMIWIDTTKNREYIYDGAQWVPHDSSVDDYYKTIASNKPRMLLTQDEVCLDGDPACTPTGAHGGPGTSPAGHAAFDCKVCHKVGGRLLFSKTAINNATAYVSPTASVPNPPAPYFDATAKTCSNIACHAVKTGTFSYYFPGGDGEPVLNTVNYGGGAPGPTPSWYATGAIGCTACHGDPPINGSDGSNVWHSGQHGNQGPTGARNQCQFCHPDASSPGNGIGNTITNAALHANGTANVQATFTSACFGCH
jgi:hypothetical protein